eukprot:g4506.t1
MASTMPPAIDESEVAMPSKNQALMDETLLQSAAPEVDLDALYVNSVVHSIRAQGTGGVARGKLWESLHRALLGLRSSKAAMRAVASAGGASHGGDILKEETRQLFYKLCDECSNFGNWDNVGNMGATDASATPTLSPRSTILSATATSSLKLPTIVSSPTDGDRGSPRVDKMLTWFQINHKY